VDNKAGLNRWIVRGTKGGDMLATTMQGAETEETAVEKLWRAVIARTVEEWVNGPLRQKREAESFLFNDDRDYRTVCYSAGINPDHLRFRLEKIRARQTANAVSLN
jgi:hypothetical protein